MTCALFTLTPAGALLAVAVATVAGQEGTVAVVSIPGVSGYLANPCHLLAQQENHQVDSRVTFNQLRQVALTNIIFANVTLHAIQNILVSFCPPPILIYTISLRYFFVIIQYLFFYESLRYFSECLQSVSFSRALFSIPCILNIGLYLQYTFNNFC